MGNDLDVFDRQAALEAMPRAFGPFLGRFGTLTDIQAMAIPRILEGRNLVVTAPAAAGKTETVLAPLCERLLQRRNGAGIGILYVVPTRALSNDIELRAQGSAVTLGLELVVRTGDRPAPVSDRGIDILVTTPESFDSLLCRHPSVFEDLRALVIDEAHLLDSNARGDQLRILVRRLGRLRQSAPPQMIAMSATVAEPDALGLRMFGEPTMVVSSDKQRPILLESVMTIGTAIREIRACGLTKVIVFGNSRKRVEEVGALIAKRGPWPQERVMVHHASLSRREREDVEKAFKRFEAGIMVATTTMEQGIDIGDVDAVVLVGAPDTAAGFYQRVGRGCRRQAGMRVWCVPEDDDDAAKFDLLLEQVRSGRLEPRRYLPDLSVVVQQTFSILFGTRRGIKRKELVDIISVLAPPPVVERILAHLQDDGLVNTLAQDVMQATTKLMDMGEAGRIHSNIADSNTVNLIDETTGRFLGSVSKGVATGDAVALGGRTWQVTGGQHGSLTVARGSGDAPTVHFGKQLEEGAFARFLPEELRRN